MKRIILIIVLISILAGALIALAAWGFRVTVEMSEPKPEFKLYEPGTEKIVQYEKYGEFVNEGKKDYAYNVKNRTGLARAVGEGIYPNTRVYRDPLYKQLLREKKLEGKHWDYLDIVDPMRAFYKWATASEDPGVKQFYTALALENAGLITQAIKAYYAVLVYFPKTISFTYWNTPWYPSKVAVSKIKYLTRTYPFLGMKLVGAKIIVENGFNLDPEDDVFSIRTGRIVSASPSELLEKQDKERTRGVKKQVGYGKINLVQYESGDWQLLVDGKPFMVRAVAYAPTKIGESPDEGNLEDWSRADYNRNSIIDAPYEAWVDRNRNNIREENEKALGDFELMKDMGVNAIRIYDHKLNSNKELLRDLYNKYGIMVIMGDLMGAYAVGSGASWYRGTNYSDPEHQKKLKERVRDMVETYRNEPYVLMWMLGNETNYGVANNAKRFPRPFYKFANDVAKMIKEIDPSRPVAICNGDTLYLDIFAELCPDVDIFGANSYRGWQGFGFWDEVKSLSDKPVIITEYGAPAYWEGKTAEEAESAQAEYLKGSWEDILYNSAGYGAGNALGGVIFEWVDEWWKAYEPTLHDAHKQWPGPAKGGWMYEEWFGLTSQGEGFDSPYMRQLRKSYYVYKSMWNPTIYDSLRRLWYNIVVKFGK